MRVKQLDGHPHPTHIQAIKHFRYTWVNTLYYIGISIVEIHKTPLFNRLHVLNQMASVDTRTRMGTKLQAARQINSKI
jgi:hypothetical protein